MGIEFLFTILVLLILALSIVKLEYGIALYWIFLCLVPLDKIPFGPYKLGWTYFIIIIFFIFLISYHRKLQFKAIKPFLVLFYLILLCIPLQTETPLSSLFYSWTMDFCKAVIIPFMVYNVFMKKKEKVINIFVYATFFAIIVAVIYSFFLLFLDGINPYIVLMNTLSEEEFNVQYYLSDSRLFGRISSVFFHPMRFAFFLGNSLIFALFYKEKLPFFIGWCLVGMIIVMCMLCGVRSVLGAIILVGIFYLLYKRKIKIVLISLLFVITLFAILSFVPELSDYVSSIFDVNNKSGNVKDGSSIGMRIDQLEGCINEISGNPLFGKGYGWVDYYQSLHGDHPIILAFESLVFVVLCENGFWGICVWVLFFMLLIKQLPNGKIDEKDRIGLMCLLIFYISYSCITGEYGYMQYFSMFYIIMMMKIKSSKIIIE